MDCKYILTCPHAHSNLLQPFCHFSIFRWCHEIWSMPQILTATIVLLFRSDRGNLKTLSLSTKVPLQSSETSWARIMYDPSQWHYELKVCDRYYSIMCDPSLWHHLLNRCVRCYWMMCDPALWHNPSIWRARFCWLYARCDRWDAICVLQGAPSLTGSFIAFLVDCWLQRVSAYRFQISDCVLREASFM